MTGWMAWTENCFVPGCEYGERGVRHRHGVNGERQVVNDDGVTRQSQGWTNNCGRRGCFESANGEWHRHVEDGSTVKAGANISQDVTAQRITGAEMAWDSSGMLRGGVINANPSKNETLWVNGVAQSKWCKRCRQARSYPDSPFCRFHDPEIALATVPPDAWAIKKWANEVMEPLGEAWKSDDKMIPWNDYHVVTIVAEHLQDKLWWQDEQKQWRMVMGDREHFCKTDVPAYWAMRRWSLMMNDVLLDRRERRVGVRDSYREYVGSCFTDEHADRLINRLRMVLTR